MRISGKVLAALTLLGTLMMGTPAVHTETVIPDDIYRYSFGLPFGGVTIHGPPETPWLLALFFGGNSGISINPLALALNVAVIVYFMKWVGRYTNRKKRRPPVNQLN